MLTFGKFFKNGSRLKFSHFRKCAKRQNLDRAILSKFFTPRVCYANFWQNFQKMAATLNFRFFCKKCENTKLLPSPKPLQIWRFRRNFLPKLVNSFFQNATTQNWSHKLYTLPIFENFLFSSKYVSHFEFLPKTQNTKLLLSH